MANPAKSFGERKLISVRVPEELYDYYDALAAEESLDLGPWVIKELSEKRELPVPAFVGRHKRRRRKDDCPQQAAPQEGPVPDLVDRRARRDNEDRSSHPAA
jgi:hypothetical protein